MKVIFCTHDGKNIINGVNTWLLRLLPKLKANGMIVEVIVTSWVDERECTIIPILKEKGIPCTIINTKKKYVEHEVRWILEYVKKESPDIVVANDMFQAWYASKWIQQTGIPVIGVLHNDNIESAERVKEFANGKNSYMMKAIVTVSDMLFKKTVSFQKDIVIRKIVCGVPLATDKNAYDSKSILRIAYVGRLSQAQKNISDIIKAFCKVVTINPKVEAYVYGSGPDIDLVYKILEEYGNPKGVVLKGNLHPDQIQNELLDIHAIILMSDFEGLPVSLMEAMAVGVVPICTRIISGVPELLIENVTGIYIDEPAELTDKIKYLQNNPDIWEELSANAKAHIAQKFSSQISDQLWLDLLQEIQPAEKTEMKIPRRIILPSLNKNVSLEDNREPSPFIKALRKTKRILSRTKT